MSLAHKKISDILNKIDKNSYRALQNMTNKNKIINKRSVSLVSIDKEMNRASKSPYFKERFTWQIDNSVTTGTIDGTFKQYSKNKINKNWDGLNIKKNEIVLKSTGFTKK